MPRWNTLRVEVVRVRHRSHQEIAGAQRPLLLVQFSGRAIGQADLVGGIVEGARRPHRPVHEVLARVLGVGVAVEHVDARRTCRPARQPRDVDLARELQRSAGEFFLLAAEAKGLAQEQPRGVVVRVGEVGLLRLAIGEAAEADGVVQTKALQQFGIVIDLAAFPEPRVEIEAVAPGRLRLRRRRQAVGAAIGRAKCRIALRQIGGLAVDLPAVGFGVGDVGVRLPARRARPVDLAVEAKAQRLEIQRRGILRARREGARWRGRTGCRDIPAARIQCGAKAYSTPAPAAQPSRTSMCFSSGRSSGALMKRSPA